MTLELGARSRLDTSIWESSESLNRWYLKSRARIRSSWEWVQLEKNLGLRTKPWSRPAFPIREMRKNKRTSPSFSSSSFFFFCCYERGLFYLIHLAFTWTKLLGRVLLGLLLKNDICSSQLQSLLKRKNTQLWAVEEASWCRHPTSKSVHLEIKFLSGLVKSSFC